jgi:hypothetical protein
MIAMAITSSTIVNPPLLFTGNPTLISFVQKEIGLSPASPLKEK